MILDYRRGAHSYMSPLSTGYVIDLKKGVYVDLSTINEKQFTKYQRKQRNIIRPDLTFRQVTEFNMDYKLGEQLLWVLNNQNTNNYLRLVRLAPPTWLKKHAKDMFAPSLAITMLHQTPVVGYNRTDTDRQKMAKFGKEFYDNAFKLGMVPSFSPQNDSRFNVDSIAQVLRDRHGIKNVEGVITVGE